MLGNETNCCSWRSSKVILALVGMVLLAGIIVVSIIRDRIVNQPQWQVSVVGLGKVKYQPDIAIINLGVQIDRAHTAESALNQLNQKMATVLQVVKDLGIPAEDIQTQNFTVFSQYDYLEGKTILAGYNANQQVVIKVRDLDQNSDLVSSIIVKSSEAGANQVNGVSFDVANLEDLKNQAKIKAIEDAKGKASSLASAAGVKLKKVIGWWENIIQAPGVSTYYYDGKGAGGAIGSGGASGSGGSVPSGLQEIIIEVNLNYQVK